MNIRRWPILLGFGLIILGTLSGCHSSEREALPLEQASRAPREAIMVTVEPVGKRSVRRTVEAVGTLHGYEEVTISTKIEGTVRTIHHDVADRVTLGEVLLEIDPTDLELAVRQAEKSLEVELAKLGLEKPPETTFEVTQVPSVQQALARLENSKLKLERTRSLRQENVSTAEELADRTVDVRVAQAEHDNQVLIAKGGAATVRVEQEDLAVARQQLRDTIIRAPKPTQEMPDAKTSREPLTYVITKRSVSEGTLVRSGTEVFRLMLDRTLKLKVSIPERHANEVELGQTADVSTAAFPKPFSGQVTRINPAVDPDTRTFEVEIQIPNPRSELKAGSFAKVAIITRTDSSATTVPLEAVVSFAGITKIFLMEDGVAREVQIVAGNQSTDWVEIREPALPVSAQVVTSGHSSLATGVKIAVRPKPDSKAK